MTTLLLVPPQGEVSLALTNEHLFLEAAEWAGLRISGLVGVHPAVTITAQYMEIESGFRLVPAFDVLPAALEKVGEQAMRGIVRSTWMDVKQELTQRLVGNGVRRTQAPPHYILRI